MPIALKPLHRQVMLITGASSGIGLATARLAAEHGTKIFLIARSEEALLEAVGKIKEAGGEASYAVADVADQAQFRSAAEKAIQTYGQIDTWVNNAGVGMYGAINEIDVADDRRLFETNFWGVVNGSRLAVEHMKDGGALINVGSEVSDVSVNVQGMYSASKHAVLGFTDAFRIEIEEANLPISVTLIKPAGINTPFPRHAKNYTDKEPTLPPPVYAPELVADQILHAATHPTRELYVGGGGRLMALVGQHFPTLMDWFMAKLGAEQQLTDRPADHTNEALHETKGYHEERGGVEKDRVIREHSLYGVVTRHPLALTAIFASVSAAIAYVVLRPKIAASVPQSLKDRAEKAVRSAIDDPQQAVQAAKERMTSWFN